MPHQVFFSFHYEPDNWRASQVRKIGTIGGNEAVSDNDWEEVTKGGKLAIKRWIAKQQSGRSCTVVLVGSNTAGRKWINHEIITSWEKNMGVVGIHIHGLKNKDEKIASKGRNPFECILVGRREEKLSSIVECLNPHGRDSRARYAWIQWHLQDIVEDAINRRCVQRW